MKEMTVVTETTTAIAETVDFKQIALQWLTSTGNLKKFTENEKQQFFDICCAFKLNPIKKEVYGVKYGDNFNIIVGYETYLKRAQRTGLLDGFNTTTVKEGNDIKAVCTIYRKDWSHPFVHEVYLSEYNTGKSLWTSKKITMIKKVAEAQAFRKCFTDEMGGLPYTAEELPEEMSTPSPNEKDITPIKVSEEKPKKNTPKYTKEQAAQLGAIVNTLDSNEQPVFTEEEKQSYRVMLVDGYFDTAMESAKEILNRRMNQNTTEPSDAELDAELQEGLY